MEYGAKKKVCDADVQFKVDTEGSIKTKVHTGILLLCGTVDVVEKMWMRYF